MLCITVGSNSGGCPPSQMHVVGTFVIKVLVIIDSKFDRFIINHIDKLKIQMKWR
jgi:hypothetical protein